MHNAKFDLKFFYKAEIFPTKVFDTLLAEKVLHTGLTMHRVALDKCLKRYFGINMPKELRTNIEKLGVTNSSVIEYSAKDVAHLHNLMDKQKAKLKEDSLEACARLEFKFTRALAYLENCGFKLDIEMWKAKMELDQKDLVQKEFHLDTYFRQLKLEGFSSQLDMFASASSMINWASPPQVVNVFEKLGINVITFDKKTKKEKKSVEEKVISSQKHEIIPKYLAFQQSRKIVTTYGQSFLDLVTKFKDNRLRTNFNQIMDTGRMSSGGNKTINLQNIPRVPEKKFRTREIYERECFCPEDGNIFVVADYSSQLGSL